MESLKRMREPAAFLVLFVLWLQLVVGLIWFFSYGETDRVLENLTIVVLALLVASCALGDRTRHARLLTVFALLGSVLMIVAALILGAVRMATEPGTRVLDLLELLLALVIPVLVVSGFVRLLRVWAAEPAAPEKSATAAVGTEEPASPESAQPALPSRNQEPVWEPDAASGVVWHTAGDAAVGAPAAGWGTPGKSGGWYPMEDEAEGPQTTETGGDS